MAIMAATGQGSVSTRECQENIQLLIDDIRERMVNIMGTIHNSILSQSVKTALNIKLLDVQNRIEYLARICLNQASELHPEGLINRVSNGIHLGVKAVPSGIIFGLFMQLGMYHPLAAITTLGGYYGYEGLRFIYPYLIKYFSRD